MVLSVLLLALCLQLGDALNISERTFITIDGNNGFRACVRLTHATGQVGCSSPSGGAKGVIHLVDSPANLEWVLSKGPHAPYVPLLSQEYFNSGNMTAFNKNTRISGALVIMGKPSDMSSAGFSPDQKCPNQGIGLYPDDQCTWNAAGNSLLLQDFDYPIYGLFPGPSLEAITNCTDTYNSLIGSSAPDYPLCSTTMNDYMHAVKDTFTCMTQGQYGPVFGAIERCDALYGFNVWGTLTGRNASDAYTARDIVMVVARLDASGMFFDVAPGAETSMSGVIALLAALRALAPQVAGGEAWAKKVVFAFFNGESFDYIGSSRMVYDMNKTFPGKIDFGENILAPATFNLSNIKTIIEVGQVGVSVVPNELFLHYDSQSASSSTLRQILTKHATANGMNFRPGTGKLPPASSQMFLRDDARIEVAFVADHNATYTNKFYNSYLDNAQNLNVTDNVTTSPTVVQLTRLATVVARTIAESSNAGAGVYNNINADTEYVRQLAYCLAVNFSCSLVESAYAPDQALPTYPVNSRYIGVNSGQNNWVTTAVQRLAALSLGRKNRTSNTSDSCKAPKGDSLYQYLFMRTEPNGTEGLCVVAPVYLYKVSSPAFDIPDYRSKIYSTWTESRWKEIGMELYLISSPASQHAAIGVGVAFVVIAVALMLQINRVSDRLFTYA